MSDITDAGNVRGAPSPATELSPLKRAFLAIEALQSRLEATQRAAREPVAVVGIGCRLPGGANSADELWDLLGKGVDAIGEVPPDRWDIDAYYDPDFRVPGKMSTRHGGFIDGIDQFDAAFFSIAPREADAMDPQQRLLLEVTWEALEDAGIAPAALHGTRTGVFIGIVGTEYAQVTLDAQGIEGLGAYYASGVAHSVASGRLSYVLGLSGPSISLDTACSSSLLAVHLAVQSLRLGESNLAIAGGVNLILTPETSVTLSKYQMMAPDGRCKFGDARADGFVRAEGGAVVVLKRLSDAVADEDRILAVIRGSAVNQDGASSGLTAPNGPAQESVIRAALADAGVRSADVAYVEAHGTGTSLGDPIELQALGQVYGATRDADDPLLVGSMKTNVGHLEAAAGVAGLLKAVLVLQHGEIPASLHFETPSPHIAWDEIPIEVPTEHRPWPATSGRRFAGLSSFGFSGTNVHLVLEEAPGPATVVEPPRIDDRPLQLVPLSARADAPLRLLADRHAARLHDGASSLADVAHTLATGRNHFAHRVAVVAGDPADAAALLDGFACGDTSPAVLHGAVHRTDPPKVAFLFTGQGAQRLGMGAELYRTQAVFRDALDRCAGILAGRLEHPLLDVLFAEEGSVLAGLLDQTGCTQPALVAIEFALVELWRSWGITPSALLGHSVGEYTAAIVAGVMTLEHGLTLVAARGRLMQALPTGGAMATVFAAADVVDGAVAALGGAVSVAAYNGPANTVVAGPASAVDALVEQFAAAGTRAQRLNVSHAFHSALLDPMLDDLETAVGAIELRQPRVRLISDLTGEVAGPEIATPGYWRRHAREAVHFRQGMAQLVQLGCDVFIEIGPHPTLLAMAQTAVPESGGLWLPSLRKGRDEWAQLLDSLGRFYVHGGRVDWAGFGRPYPHRRLSLPTYAFERQRHWVAPGPGRARSTTGAHPLLGRRVRSPLRPAQFEQELTQHSLDFVDDHRVHGTAILPATGFLEVALAAGRALTGRRVSLERVEILSALVFAENEARTVQTILVPNDDDADAGGATFEILSQGAPDDAWLMHARGRLEVAPPSGSSGFEDPVDLDAVRARCAEAMSGDEHYDRLRDRGLDFGPSLRGVSQVWLGATEVLVDVRLNARPSGSPADYEVHPALLDGCLQSLVWLSADDDDVYLPIAIERLDVVRTPGTRAFARASVRTPTPGASTRTGDIAVYDAEGRLVLAVHGLAMKRISRDAFAGLGAATLADSLYALAWRPVTDRVDADGAPSGLPGDVELLGAAHAVSDRLADELDLGAHQRLVDALDELSGQYVVLALGELGVPLAVGEHFTSGDLPVVPAHRRLVERLLASTAADGLLRREPGGWSVAAPPPEPSAVAARWEQLAERHPDGHGELAIVKRCGEGLAAALQARADPLQLLFPGGSSEAAEAMYRESPFARYYNGLVGLTVAAAAAALPAGRRLRVLEIGGGTGGTTAHVLPRLSADRSEYTFTDISPLFVARAAERYSPDTPYDEFRTLDIEADPQHQGFAAHAYDVVVAANVLHATTDLRHTFAHVADLLAPGGALVLLEMTTPHRYIDISFGLTPGWWKFTDVDLRPDSLLLDRAGWVAFLGAAGFGDVRAAPALARPTAPGAHVEPGLDPDVDLALQTVLVARTPMSPGLPAGRRSWLILADSGGVGRGLAALIDAAGGTATTVTMGPPGSAARTLEPRRWEVDPTRADDLGRLVTDAPGGWDGVVHLWSLDHATGSLLDGQQQRTGSALAVAQSLLTGTSPRLFLVTRGAQSLAGADADPAQAPLWGLGRVIALEHPELGCTCIDLDPSASADAPSELFAELTANRDESQVALRSGTRYVARLTRAAAAADSVPVPVVRLQLAASGVLDGMAFAPAVRRAPGPGEVEIRVHAAGLNFRDVMNALAMRDDQQPAGSECAGVVVAVGDGVDDVAVGDAVLAVAPGSFGTFVTTSAHLVAPKPQRLSFEQAATIPLAFLTAHRALHGAGRLVAGESVLIHAGAGGVGLAALQMARRIGARPLVTAGSAHKRAFLAALGVDTVLSSRSTDFVAGVLAATDDRGVDVVLNSLTGELVAAGLDVLAPGGRFVELGKREVLSAEQVAAQRPGITYDTIALAEDLEQRPHLVRPVLREMVDAFAAGELEPLPVQTFAFADAPAAFRFMAQARHVGKVVLLSPEAESDSPAGPTAIRDDATYVVTGGLSGIGLAVAEWLVERGARHIALMARRAPDANAEAAIARMTERGAAVVTQRVDVSDRGQVAGALVAIAAQLPAVRGVFHSAGVLDDGALTRQDWGRFATVLMPKVEGSWNLHQLTLGLDLDHFVMFSSAASLLGSRGQANHAAANSFLDALAASRRAHGLSGLSINWGGWSDVGSVETHGVRERLDATGAGVMTPAQGLAALGALMEQGRPQVAVIPIDWPAFLRQFAGGTRPALLSELARESARATPAGRTAAPSAAPATPVLREQLLAAPAGQQRQLLLDFVGAHVAVVLGLPSAENIDERGPLHELGLDSLMAVELRNMLGIGLGTDLPATLVFDHPTVEALATYLAVLVGPSVDHGPQAADEPAPVVPEPAAGVDAADDLLASIEMLSDDDVARLLGD
ncbi:MAG: hypothetical protein JWM12_2806 [Ilumatobacteraceae bacterium]|nr:hypothetical protein [Ilumatobacteraceae bacterium]